MKFKQSNRSAFKPWNRSAFKPWNKSLQVCDKPGMVYIISYSEILELIKGFPELENSKTTQELQELLDGFSINRLADGSLKLFRLN
jgi:hypothetical protein